MTVTQNELKAFLEEGAKKFGISYDTLEHAIWRQREENYLRNDIKSYLDKEGISYTEDDVEVILDNLDTNMEDMEIRVMDAIDNVRSNGELSFGEDGKPLDVPTTPGSVYYEFDEATRAKIDADDYHRYTLETEPSEFDISVPKCEVSGDWAFGTLRFDGEEYDFQYNIDTTECRIPDIPDNLAEDFEAEIRTEIEAAAELILEHMPKVTDIEIDGKLIAGTIEFEGTTAAFEYDPATEAWSTKDEFTPEMDAAVDAIDNAVHTAVAKFMHELDVLAVYPDSIPDHPYAEAFKEHESKFEIAQGLHTYHVVHPDFGNKSLFEIDIPENIAEMSPEDIQSFIDGTLEDAAEYIEHQYGLELTATDVGALKGELKDVCDERTAEGPLRGSADALINSIRNEVVAAFEENDIDYTANQLEAVTNTVLHELTNGAESYDEAMKNALVKHGMVKTDVLDEMESFGFTEGERSSLESLIAAAGEPTGSEPNRNEKDKDAR